MSEKSSTTYGYLDRIATALEDSIGTYDPDNDKHTASTFKYLDRIATAVENGAGGGSGGYSKKPGEIVIFHGDAVFVHVVGDEDNYYILKESAESSAPVVMLDKFYGETALPSELTLTGLPEVLFGATTRVFHFEGYIPGSRIFTANYSYGEGDEHQQLSIISNLERGQSALSIRRDARDSSLEDVYNVNLKLYGTSEVLEVTKDFTNAVGEVTGYKIDTTKVLLDTYQVEEVPNDDGDDGTQTNE